jgi:ribosomal protein S18 acetylase RimI-like enzyme
VRHVLVSDGDDAVCGFVLLGRSTGDGYVQRLAVAPGSQGRGFGRALLGDGLRWLRSSGAARVLVNTQVGNDRAFSLYRRAGFEELPVGLCVLGRHL